MNSFTCKTTHSDQGAIITFSHKFSGAAVKILEDHAVVKSRGKTRITIHLDDDVIETFRVRAEKVGHGYQTLINDALRQYLSSASKPVDSKTLRRILREELNKTS